MVQTPHWDGDAEAFVDTLFYWMSVTGRRCRDGSQTILSRSTAAADRAIAEKAGNGEVCAALLHAVGTLLVCTDLSCDTGSGSARSQEIGARWLSAMFPYTVSEPVKLLPQAHRWLLATDKNFRDTLSDTLMRELAIAGGPMVGSERSSFEGHTCFSAAVALSRRAARAHEGGPSSNTLGDLARFRSPVLMSLVYAPTESSLVTVKPGYPPQSPVQPATL